MDGTLQVKAPFHLAIDQEDRIWVTNSGSNTVTRFPTSDPNQAEEIEVGFAPRAIAIDSQGNAWIANTGGLQIVTDLDIDPAGNLWVANNWDLPREAGFKEVPPEALSTRFGGNGAVIFFGMARPVRTPLIGPPRVP